ncbi:galactose mutarotase [bacterium]|nr:galactose mutarotase [bacterium]
MYIKKSVFGKLAGETDIDLYTLVNDHGLKMGIITYGGIVVSLEVPDRNGKLADVALGPGRLEDYAKETTPFFGAIIGRYTNRIAGGRFMLHGQEYRLTVNEPPNHLHGGFRGFNRVVWHAEPFETVDAVGLRLRYLSKDGEEGYPGNLSCTVAYILTNQDALQIAYEAETDRPTPVNLTNHTYFNLAGHDAGPIFDHELTLTAIGYTPFNETGIPTGEILSVKDTPFDFTKPRKIGEGIAALGRGYDHNLAFAKSNNSLSAVARVFEPTSGRVLEVETTEPGVQLYTCNFADCPITGKGGKIYQTYDGLCLEIQHFPDSPNKPHFPSTILEPGERYKQLTVHRFFTQ